MTWRALLGVLACALALGAQAQATGKKHRIGVLVPSTTTDFEAFKETLRRLGYEEASLAFDIRIAGDRFDKLSAMASEIVKASPDVILALNTPGTKAAMAATRTIPIVMVAVGDPVGMGFVRSFARPDRNVTGVTNQCGELAGKRLAIFKEALPEARRIAILYNSVDPITRPQIADVEKSTPALGIETRLVPLRTNAELDAMFPELLKWRADGILWLCGQQGGLTRHMLPLAARHRVPVMVYISLEVPMGGLISYSTDNSELYRRAAVYVDKILKGTKVADLPVEQPTKFDLVINLKVAAALGLKIPNSLLVRADRVIE